MNSAQKKLVGSVLCLSGLALIAYGGYELYTVYDHNHSLNEIDQSLGGLVSGLTDLLGSEVKLDYTIGSILTGVGLIDFIFGWVILGKVK
jgi:hypothetical protein